MSASNVKWVRLGDYIERSMKNNSDLKYGKELIEGVNSDGVFCKSKANTDDVDLKPYKIVNKGDFVPLTITQPISLSNILAALRIIFKCPLVTGSKLPG